MLNVQLIEDKSHLVISFLMKKYTLRSFPCPVVYKILVILNTLTKFTKLPVIEDNKILIEP